MTMQNKISWWKTSFNNGEAQEITKAISNKNISQGPVVAELEKQLGKYLEVPYVVATTSGSMALLMSCWVLGIGPGDEVIVPNRTWIATAHAPILLGAKVVLVDVETDRPIIDTTLIEKAITKNTKAIIPVHMCGRSADMRTINQLAAKYGIAVIEDAAQALGSRNSDGLLGTQSDLGCFSFSVAKIIATGQGGFIATKNETLYKKLIAMRTHGVGDIVNADWDKPGFNFRFTDILAAIGIQQLKLITSRIEKAKEIYKLYEKGLDGIDSIKLIKVDLEAGEVPVYIEALCERRSELINFLEVKGIQCRPFYPDLNKAKYLNTNIRFLNSEPYGRNAVYLPSGPEQDLNDIQRVIDEIKLFSK
jgi:perosamine synthetase